MKTSTTLYSANQIASAYPFSSISSKLEFARELRKSTGKDFDANLPQFKWKDINNFCMSKGMKPSIAFKIMSNLKNRV